MVGETPHSVAHQRSGWRLSAPSAARNIAPILEALAPYVSEHGVALEIASGTGEHAVAFAQRFPGIVWQPTDVDVDRLASVDAWRAHFGLRNMRVAQQLDATTAEWQVGPYSLVVTINLLHLISRPAAKAVVAGVARSLNDGGHWFLYGPFRSDGDFRSEGDRSFHTSLSGHDPEIGYKDIETVERWAVEQDLERVALIEMPANNLALVLRKPQKSDERL